MNKTRMWLSIAVLLTALLDAATFLAFKQFHIFEINPAYILTKSVLFVILLKFALVGLLVFVINRQVTTKTMQYAIVLSAIYICLFQVLGAYSNCQVAATAPPPSAALAPEVAIKTYAWVSGLYYLLPIVVATFAFWLFNKSGYDDSK